MLFRSQADREIFAPFGANARTLLYAPTWQDADGATSFFTHLDKVLADVPAHWNVIVKVHPLLEQRNPAQYYDALRRLEEGTYGVCGECHKVIEKARIKALPFVRMCIRCQSESEKGKTKYRPLSNDTTM